MARITNGFLGNASGKLGNVVFSRWRELNTARQYQPDIHDANSPSQQKQRSRMVSLLQFLKPLNKNFIKFFNTPYAKGSTPWAIAIHDNMAAVSSDGCMSLRNFNLGSPKFPAFDVFDISYDPFTNQTHFQYKKPVANFQNNPFPYLLPCVLGEYPSTSGVHEFDIRHLLCSLPDGHFWCSITDEFEEHVYDNSWSGIRFWMVYYHSYDITKIINPAENVSQPVFVEAPPIIEGFNTRVKENLVPVNSLSWDYVHDDPTWYLKLTIDISKTTLENPADYTLIFWWNGLIQGNHYFNGPEEWDLQESDCEMLVGDRGFSGSAIALYAVFNKEGEQVSCFNRFYINHGTDGKEYPYFEQLFDCNYSNAASFVLPDGQCGFCGNLETLFGELLSLWDQGFVPAEENPLKPLEKVFKLHAAVNGSVEVSGQVKETDSEFIFLEKAKATLQARAAESYVFSEWKGADAADVVALGNDTFELEMSKNRTLTPEFIVKEI